MQKMKFLTLPLIKKVTNDHKFYQFYHLRATLGKIWKAKIGVKF